MVGFFNLAIVPFDNCTPLAYDIYIIPIAIPFMLIVETSIFTRQVQKLLPDDTYRELQITLAKHPDMGTIIVGSGGLRKIRWAAPGRGKRGGVRVIYFWAVTQNRLLMLLIYPKSEQDNLTREQLKILRRIVEEEYS